MKKEYIKSSIIILVVVIVFGGLMFGLNFITGPIIEENQAGAELAPLKEVLPNGEKFEAIYDKANASASTLQNVKEHVSKIYKETTDKGYVFVCETTSQYSKSPMIFTVGVTIDGKISGVKVNEYHESLDFEDYPNSYIGKDSTLADVGVHAGVTYSSNAFKEAMQEGFEALISNNLIKEGVKTEDQILTELIPTVHPGLASNGNLKATEVAISGNIVKGYKADNDSGFALIIKENDTMYLAVTNALGGCKVYDVEGNDVTSLHEAIVTEATTYQTNNGASLQSILESKVSSMVENVSDVEKVEANIFNTVVAAIKFKSNENTYYGFYTKNFGFQLMNVYFVIDENGAIVSMKADEFVFEKEYFSAFDKNWSSSDYINGFVGLTDETFDGSQALIAAATMSSNAMKQATNDSFATFKAVKEGGSK